MSGKNLGFSSHNQAQKWARKWNARETAGWVWERAREDLRGAREFDRMCGRIEAVIRPKRQTVTARIRSAITSAINRFRGIVIH